MKKRTRTRKPTSVGEILSEEFLTPLGLTQKAFAEHLDLDVKTINRLVNGKTSVTPPLALKMASALGTTPEFWMNLQVANDRWELKNTKIDLPSLISA